MHKNLLVGWTGINKLTTMKRLKLVTLQGNPCAKIVGYRNFMADNLPQLLCLDKFIVMDFERKAMADIFPSESMTKKRLQQLDRFRP